MVSGEHPTRGSVEGQLTRAALRILAVARLVVALVGGLLGVMSAPAGHELRTAVIVITVSVWSLLYARWLWQGPPPGLAWADVAVLGATGLLQPWTVPPESVGNGQGWVITLVSVAVVFHQWHTKPVPGLASSLMATAAFLVGAWWTTPEMWVGAAAIGAFTPVQAILSRVLVTLLVQAARAADAQEARAEAARREAAVAEAVRADERAHVAMLHDTAATTLLMVGLGEVGSHQQWVREQARRDLAALAGETEVAEGDALPALLEVINASRVRVDLTAPDALPVSPEIATAVRGALREALNNVARHSGETTATVTVADGSVVIADRGTGFRPENVSDRRRGVANSIVERLAAAGGRAVITSAPGEGTTVRLEWDRG
ncbi:sensor histidine kinase [Kutzneria kofuensis]|uniref:Signal transduction histidine kinase n=1 Tax=Kutzneria kofuensis TaxID=103725 RepID=A0A7W9NL19_9PSEU|nr:ATP-binding protein [Kutzneria kofuensis]MBB5895971.1 signal transduction histidine kinase [Kutzneria kofuensis]